MTEYEKAARYGEYLIAQKMYEDAIKERGERLSKLKTSYRKAL